MNKGCSFNVKSPNDYCPIHYACYGGAIEVAAFLCTPDLINVKDLNYSPPGSEFTPIYLATLSKSPHILQLLFDSGAKIPTYSLESLAKTPMNQAIKCKDYECLSIILNHTNSQKLDEKNYTPLMKAISYNFSEAAKILVDNGADVCYTTPDMKNALYLACYKKDEGLVKYLLENGADAISRGYNGQCPIHWASLSGNINIVKLIFAYGADPNVYDSRGRLPTFSALIPENRDKILKILLDAGCNPNAKQKNNNQTILSSLVSMPEDATVLNSIKIVLESGGDLNHICKNKLTVYQFAKRVGSPAMVKVFDDFISENPGITVK